MNFSAWAEAVVHPLGLAGFALFLVFILITRFRKKISLPMKFLFIVMAFASLGGGLFISYQRAISEEKAINIKVTVDKPISNVVSGSNNNVSIKLGSPTLKKTPDGKIINEDKVNEEKVNEEKVNKEDVKLKKIK